MTLNQLRTFLAVADSGSVRSAAEELVVTQAAISASLAALQRSLAVQLLQPEGRGVRLTPAGLVFAGYARRALGLLEEASRAAAAAADPERGELRIAAVTTAAEQIMPGLLSGFLQRHPDVGVLVQAGNRERVTSLLERHQVDLVLAGRPAPGSDLEVLAVRPNHLVVVAAAALARARGSDDMVPWLARQTWLMREPGSGTRATAEALLADLDITPLSLTLGSNGAIRESAGIGLGVTLVSRDAIEPELRQRPAARARRPRHAAAPRLVPRRPAGTARRAGHLAGRTGPQRRGLPAPQARAATVTRLWPGIAAGQPRNS